MNRLLIFLVCISSLSVAAQPASGKRVIHNDPATYRTLASVHAGAGDMGFTQLIGRNDLSTNFLYLHTGIINGKSGIGHHFHHSIEEMYVLLSGEAEFTINGRTSVLKAPAIVPCKLGDAHAIYNAGDTPVKWLNFAVSETKGRGDAFDLGDDRVGATIDPIPVFVSGQLDKDKLRNERHPYVEQGIRFRRLLGPEIFRTSWDHVDHLVIPAGKTLGPLQIGSVEEVFYVIGGSGKLKISGTEHDIIADDAFAGLLSEELEISNTGSEDLELLVIGVAVPGNQDIQEKSIALQMDFLVSEENMKAFEEMYHSIYVPAMKVQDGYLGSKLLKIFPENVASEIQADPTEYNYSIQIFFTTEESRRRWVASDQHQIAWPAAEKLASKYRWRGFDVMGEDDQ